MNNLWQSWLTSQHSWSVWAIHRSTEVFGPDANVFHPERWLGVPEAQLHKMERSVIISIL